MDILDRYGRPMKAPRKAALADEVGGPTLGGVRQIASGHPADGLTPARLGSILREAETGDATAYLELAEQMEEKDLHYAAVLGVRKRAIRRLNLVVESAGDDERSDRAAELVRDTLNASHVTDILVDLLDGLGKGYSAVEIQWNTRVKPWVPYRLIQRDPRWFRFDQTDGTTPLLRGDTGDEPFDQGKFVFHVPKLKSGLPIRGGLARLAAWAYIFKNYTLKDWAVFMEAYGHPLRIGKHSTSATAEDRETLLRAVRRLGTDMAAIMPNTMEIELVNGNVTGADKMFEGAARYWDEQLSKAILGQVSTTDAIAGGHAVGKVHNLVREDIRDADAEQLASTLRRDLAAPLTIWNFGPDTPIPVVRFEAEEERDPRLTMLAIKTFGPMGLTIAERQVRELFGLREPDEGEAVLTFSKPPAAPPPGQGAEPPNPEDAERLETAAAQAHGFATAFNRALDAVVEDGTAQGAMDSLLGGLLDAIDSATTMEDVRDLLAQAVEAAPDETMRELLAQLTYSARLAGRLDADLG